MASGWALGLGVRVIGAVVLAVASAACDATSSPHGESVGPAREPTTQSGELRVIQHEEPRRDFVGGRPTRFRWSAIAGADRYAIGLWNEADRLLWRRDDLTETSVDWPAELYADPGTYFWSVSALENGREIAKSGMAAFVVE
jgi:hypothetical protein